MTAGPHHQGNSVGEAKIESILRQFRLMNTDSGVNWSELGRRSGVSNATAKKYVEQYLKEQRREGGEVGK